MWAQSDHGDHIAKRRGTSFGLTYIVYVREDSDLMSKTNFRVAYQCCAEIKHSDWLKEGT